MPKDCPKCRTINSDVALVCDCGYVFKDQLRSAATKKQSGQVVQQALLREAPSAPEEPVHMETERALAELEALSLGYVPARGTRGKSGLNTEQRRIISWTCTLIAAVLVLASMTAFGIAGFIGAIVAFAIGRVVWAGRSSLPGSLD